MLSVQGFLGGQFGIARKFLRYLSLATLAFSGSACSDATGQLIGGESIYDANMPTVVAADGATPPAMCPSGIPNTVATSEGGTPGWTEALFPCYFASCGSLAGGCHQGPMDSGSLYSGFVCGTAPGTCLAGLSTSIASGMPPLVPAGTTDATKTALWAALHITNPAGGLSNNMPLSPTYVFTPQDLAAIQTWIQSGSPNN